MQIGYAGKMRVFLFVADFESSSPMWGYVRAADAAHALATIRHPGAAIYSLPANARWPGEPDMRICAGKTAEIEPAADPAQAIDGIDASIGEPET